jgi:RimJ/RimL family protein N-acetyltransferase
MERKNRILFNISDFNNLLKIVNLAQELKNLYQCIFIVVTDSPQIEIVKKTFFEIITIIDFENSANEVEFLTKQVIGEEDIFISDRRFIFEENKIKEACFKSLFFLIVKGKVTLYEGVQNDISEKYSDKMLHIESLSSIFKYFERERHLSIRKAEENDMLTYFDWVNDSEVRASAINGAPIALSNHEKWFLSKINQENSHLYIFEKNNSKMGQVRFDKVGDVYETDYSIDKKFRGKGYGKVIMFNAIKELIRENDFNLLKIIALVKETNFASNKVFLSVGFKKKTEIKIKNFVCNNYEWSIQ